VSKVAQSADLGMFERKGAGPGPTLPHTTTPPTPPCIWCMMAEKHSRFCAETKKKSTECQFFGCFCPADHCDCAHPFLAVSAQWITVDCENGPLCSRETEKKHFFRLICGVKYPIPGSKRSFSKKNVHFPPPDHCAPVITKIQYEPGQGDTNFFFSNTRNWIYGLKGAF
jgi:hypothetical protein